MEVEQLYEDVIAEYPAEINLTGSTIHPNGGVTIPALIAAHDCIQARFISHGNESEAMDWAVFQVLHATAVTVLKQGGVRLVTKSIGLDAVLECFMRNLSEIRDQREGNAT